ncbi:MAG: adenosine deaminase family protein [Polyangiaceae bacterium]|nr:adenosine deaminase family protein [Polyangiaceae bacterium]
MSTLPSFAELHRHLDGSIRPSTLVELATRLQKTVPNDLPFSAGMGLSAALSRFAFTLSLLQDPAAVKRVASEMCEDAEAEGVTSLEIRFAPQLHQGAPIASIVDAAVEGIRGRAGLILCGLYGEPPTVLDELVSVAASRPHVVGIDLAGGPSPTHNFQMVDYAPAFKKAATLGLGRTVHAGEGRPAEEIETAILTLGAERIGHGTTLLNNPRIANLVLEKQITIEACPTSNVHTGAIHRVEDHPISTWLDLGIRACICADNTLLSGTNVPMEIHRVRGIVGMTEEKIQRAIQIGHEAAFRRK